MNKLIKHTIRLHFKCSFWIDSDGNVFYKNILTFWLRLEGNDDSGSELWYAWIDLKRRTKGIEMAEVS